MKYNFEVNDRQIVVNNKYYAIGQLNKHLSYHFTICIISYFITIVNNFIKNIIYLFISIYYTNLYKSKYTSLLIAAPKYTILIPWYTNIKQRPIEISNWII